MAAKRGGRFFADGRFYHADGRARMVPVAARPPAVDLTAEAPFRLNTGRLRDQWHTMTRSGLSPRLSAHMAEPFLDIHPEDALRLGLGPATIAEVSNPQGTALLRVRITSAQRQGEVFAPMHWTGETAPCARIDALVPGHCDPISGQPESKAAAVSVQPFAAAWYGFAVADRAVTPTCAYWARATTTAGCRVELAGRYPVEDWEAEARMLFALPEARVASVLDPARGTGRVALFAGDRLVAALFVSRNPVAVMRDYLADLPGTAGDGVLTGRRPADQPDPGPMLCACFGVGVNTIVSAIETRGLMSVEAVGEALQAGTNCGSCRPEIADLLTRIQTRTAAE